MICDSCHKDKPDVRETVDPHHFQQLKNIF